MLQRKNYLITKPEQLFESLSLGRIYLSESIQASKLFACRVPREFVARMKKSDPRDPLLQQVLPSKKELVRQPGYSENPLGEQCADGIPGLLHRYNGRVLLILAGDCPIHCRYCFRRHFHYDKNIVRRKGWDAIIGYIKNDPTIEEIIYSGGEPLLLSDNLLAELTEKIAAIPHVKRLRIHTRMPIVIPDRVNNALINWLSTSELKIIIVLHCNHANEIDKNVKEALHRLREKNIILFNQAVLLRGINDAVAAQIDLNEALFSAGVIPYYLHMLDRVHGAAHFEVLENEACRLIQELQKKLPGYLMPRLIKEIDGEKIII